MQAHYIAQHMCQKASGRCPTGLSSMYCVTSSVSLASSSGVHVPFTAASPRASSLNLYLVFSGCRPRAAPISAHLLPFSACRRSSLLESSLDHLPCKGSAAVRRMLVWAGTSLLSLAKGCTYLSPNVACLSMQLYRSLTVLFSRFVLRRQRCSQSLSTLQNSF